MPTDDASLKLFYRFFYFAAMYRNVLNPLSEHKQSLDQFDKEACKQVSTLQTRSRMRVLNF